jgi:hypothetical protein
MQLRRVEVVVCAVGSALAMAAGALRADIVEERTLEESVPVDGAPHVVVENVFGSIRVTAHDRATVEMSANETVRADTRSDLERARTEAALRTERDGNEVAFLVRHGEDDDCNCRWNRWDDYVVEYDIELRVPENASLDLSTVNKGEIHVEGVHGDFEVANVNGAVTLRGLRGAGSATTVNGELDAAFERTPAGATEFRTVNGRVEVAFPADLSADLAFKTMHGEIWTDFDAEPLAVAPTSEVTREGTRYVIHSDRRSMVRVGRGGPTHSFETLNGDIYVVEAQR